MVLFVILLVLLATLSIACALIAFIYGSGKWVRRFSTGFAVFIFTALLSLVYMFIKQ